MKKRVSIKGKSSHETLKAFHILANATVALNESLKEAARIIHSKGELTDARRTVLMRLHRYGPQTVSKMARAQKVSRQHVQTIVNILLTKGLLELTDNPDHKRSCLVRLTSDGESLVHEMNSLEADIMSRVNIEVKGKEMLEAAEILMSLVKTFESRQWKKLLEKFNL